ncbi:hypothetical protein FRC05_006688 [Tulasnella sp. 425]|nr:hypothetical protein FRC05_006688 [Tulasnella sp. 425]
MPPCLVVARSHLVQLIAIRHSHGIQLLVPPPIALDKFVLPYKDVLGWKYLRDEQRAVYGVKKGLKRKTEEKNAPATSTRPINKEKRLNLQGLLLNVDFRNQKEQESSMK